MIGVLCSFVRVGRGYIFFFKQKTAYEMRISDWSSDVCSSDLFFRPARPKEIVGVVQRVQHFHGAEFAPRDAVAALQVRRVEAVAMAEIGRASCRERVCQYV